MIAKYPSFFFIDNLYDNFKRILSPSVHLREQGESYIYSEKQKDIIYGKWEKGQRVVTLEQRIKGVFGSGKTITVRTVSAVGGTHKRVC